MFRRFINLFMQDMMVAFRNYFHYVILFLAFVMIIVINFAIPNQVKLTPNEVFFDNSEEKVLEQYIKKQGISEDRIFNSREALENEVNKNNNSIGIVMEGNLDNPKFTVIHQGTESPEIINVLDATIEETLNILKGTVKTFNYHIEYLRPKSSPIPFNKSVIPIMLLTEAIMLGFLLIAVMVFQEKEEGSVRAYRITPSGILEYILSKSCVNVLLALVYSVLVILFTIGPNANYPSILLIIALSSFLMTLVGLSVSVFFRNLQEFLFVGVFIIAVAGLPLMSYMNPSFSPNFFTWFPSYPVLFGIREVLFPTGKENFLTQLNLTLAVEGLLFLGISYWAVNKKIMKEGK